MVGFRFPAYAEGIEVAGYHLHFVADDRRRGGHVLDSRLDRLRVARSTPPTTSTSSCRRRSTSAIPDGSRRETHAAIAAVEGG